MRNPLSIAITFIAILLAGAAIHFAIEYCVVSARRFDWWLQYPRWGIYAAEYIVFATWLAWGPPTLLSRVAAVSVLGLTWMVANWAGLWAAKPGYFAAFGAEKLQVFTLAPLALSIGTLPLVPLRRWFRFEAPSQSVFQNAFWSVAWALVLVSTGMVVIAAHCFRGRDLGWDLLIAMIIAVVLGAIAAATAPLFARGFLGKAARPQPILIACLMLPMLGIVASRFFGMPGPGAAGVVYATAEAAVAALVTTLLLCLTFGWWRLIGMRFAARDLAEQSLAAESR